jgi:hypothetical protein
VRIDLWAIDAGAGEALLRQGDEWLLLSLDAEWSTVPLRGPADVARWLSSSLAIPVGRSYEELDQAIADAREASLAVLRPLLGPGETDLLPQASRYHPPPSDERRNARAEFLGRALRRHGTRAAELFREVIDAEVGRLERCFEGWGFAPSEVPTLVATCFDRLFADPRGWADEAALKTRLFILAEELHRGLPADRGVEPASQETGDQPLEQLVGRRIAGLPQDVVETLATWTDLDLEHREVQVLLQFSPEELEWRLRLGARAIGLAAELLRARLFAPGCRRAAERVLARRRAR